MKTEKKPDRATAYHVTPICLFRKTKTQNFPFYLLHVIHIHVLICYIIL